MKPLFAAIVLSCPALASAQSLLVLDEDKVVASDYAAEDYAGAAVSLCGDTAAVGAPIKDEQCHPFLPDCESGAVYIHVRSNGAWMEQAKLASPASPSFDGHFGFSVALDGDLLVAGEPGGTRAVSQGVAYVFERSGAVWTPVGTLVASDGMDGDDFGFSVAIAGETVVVGAPGADSGGTNAGAAYVYSRNGSSWTETKLSPPSVPGVDYWFGWSVAVAATTVVVGAPLYQADGEDFAGLGFVYVPGEGGGWAPQATLVADDPRACAQVGWDVDISGDTVVLGSPLRPLCGGVGDHSAYVFVREGTAWCQEAKLLASGSPGQFGRSVSVDGNRALVGSYLDVVPGHLQGAAYVFGRVGSAWMEKKKLTSADGQDNDHFGASTALDGDTALIGAYGADVPLTGPVSQRKYEAGAAYVFELFDDPATVVNRTAGANPASYAADPAVLGAPWTATVDLSTTGHALAQVLGYAQPASVVHPGGQVQLVGGPRVFKLPFQAGPLARWTRNLPLDPALAGLTAYTQALHYDPVLPFALSNAQDLFLGL